MVVVGKTLAHRLTKLAKIYSPARSAAVPCDASARFLQKRPIFQPALPQDIAAYAFPQGNSVAERILSLNGNRIRLDSLFPPPPRPTEAEEEDLSRVTVENARKFLRATQMEAARTRLRAMPHSAVSYGEFLRICREEAGEEESGYRVARLLDESGSVVVLGDAVLLRPDLVTKAIEKVIALASPFGENARENKELKSMEEKKGEIDRAAAAQVRQELWAGLGFLILQTGCFMRLTFWELSWDVMEPICFYVTSFYFLAGYAFFLRTSREPSFEGFFCGSFAAKQKRLMKQHNFDLDRFHELKRASSLASQKITTSLPENPSS